MATQGLFTIIRNNQVEMKIITGSEGMKMPELVRAIRAAIDDLGRTPTTKEAYDIALEVGFGTESSLVVMDRKGIKHKTGEPINRRYRKTFDKPEFNPRWKLGTTDHLEVIWL